MSRSTLALFLYNLVGMIQTTVFAQSLSNFTCQLFMMRGRTLLIWDHRVKGQGQIWHFVFKTLWALYRLQFLPNHFQTSVFTCKLIMMSGGTLLILGGGAKIQAQIWPPARGCHTSHCLVNILFFLQYLYMYILKSVYIYSTVHNIIWHFQVVSEENDLKPVNFKSIPNVNTHVTEVESSITGDSSVPFNDVQVWVDPLDATQEYTGMPIWLENLWIWL